MITLLLLLFTKHFLADFVLQTNEIAAAKGEVFHPLFHRHLVHHVALTALCLMWFAPFWLILLICILEYMLHWWIDYTKVLVNSLFEIKITDPSFWWALGFDQYLHAVCYIAIIGVVF